MLMLLCRNDLWEYVNGSIPTADIRTVAWRKGNAKALGTIALGCEKSQSSIKRHCKHAREAWEKLGEAHAQ